VAQAAPSAPVHLALLRAAQAHGELMQPLACPYTWEDLVVPPNLQAMLKDFESQVLLRWEVYEEWGFARRLSTGRGIVSLFTGEPGTGKTLCAHAVAGELGRTMLEASVANLKKGRASAPVDLAQVARLAEKA